MCYTRPTTEVAGFLPMLFYSPEAMDKANSRFRIGLMMSTMVFTLLGCVAAIRQGRKESQDSNNMVHSRNLNRYKSR